MCLKSYLNEAKEKYEQVILSKDSVIVSKDSNIQLLRDMLLSKQTEILGIQGLMTCRGIFEFYLNCCHGELQAANMATKKDNFKVSNVIKLITKADFQIPKDSIWIRNFLFWLKECGCTDLLALCAKLCSGIHGAAWYGKLLQVERCIMEKIKNQLAGQKPKNIRPRKPHRKELVQL